MSAFDSFGPLDDLVQVIYQGAHRFVLLSRIEFDAPTPGWNVHLGLADAGRWWRGRWAERDLSDFVGTDVSTALLEAFADNLARSVVQGELFVGGWPEPESDAATTNSGTTTTEEGAALKIIFGPTGKRPLAIALTALSAADTAVFLTDELFSLGLAAQQRKCRLNPPAFPIPSYPSTAPPPAKKARRASPGAGKEKRREASPPKESSSARVQPDSKPKPKAKTRVQTAKTGRKIQTMEFASDDE